MTIEFHCTSCNKMLRVKDESAGKKAKCPACSTILQIPATGSPAAEGPAESNPFDFSAPSPTRNAPAAPASDNPFASPQESYDAPHVGAARPGEIVATRIDAGDIFSTTWDIFKSQMGMTIGVYFVTFFINLAVGFVLGIIQGIMGEDAVAIAIVLQLAANLFSIFLTIGLLLIYLDIARGRAASFDKLFAGGPYFLPVILATLLVMLCVYLGLILLIVPGIIVGLMWSQYYLLILDQKMGVMDSIKKSMEITKGNKGTLFLIGLGVFGLSIVGMIPCGLGLIFIIPYTMLMYPVAYLKMTGQPVSAR